MPFIKVRFCIFCICFFLPEISIAQEMAIPIGGVVNKYAKVSLIDTLCDFVEVSNPEHFMSGDKVLLIQMQGAQISETNTVSFGNVIDYHESGNYEYSDVMFVYENRVYLKSDILRSYNTLASVQLVKTPVYQNAIVMNPINCPPWDGETGGIISIIIEGTIELRSHISTMGNGFRGGRIINFPTSQCTYVDYFASLGQGIGGQKGEGIARYISGKDYARGKNANGGGGGNVHNSGGGGGSNAGEGGKGGSEWINCSLLSSNAGIGGASIDYLSSLQKVFMGGGGGGGNQNDGVGTNGVSGGGIVIIQFDKMIANNQSIDASGLSQTAFAGVDSGGGGGAGGAVLLKGNEISGNLLVVSNGGKGGGIQAGGYSLSDQWGTGGGGGGGLLWISDSLTNSSIVSTLNGGGPGDNPIMSDWGATMGQPGMRLTDLLIPTGTFKNNIYSEIKMSVCAESAQFSLMLDCINQTSWILPYSDSIITGSELNIAHLDSSVNIIGVCGDLLCPDSIVIYYIHVDQTVTLELNERICSGEAYFFNGESLTSTGVYPFTITNPEGCDSLVIIDLTVFEPFNTIIHDTICQGNLYDFYGSMFGMEGVYEHLLQSEIGCDSLITLNLYFFDVQESTIDTVICEGSEYIFNGISYSQPGVYQVVFQDSNGCDSTVSLRLQTISEVEENLSVSICQGTTYNFAGQPLTVAGQYVNEILNPFGCDTISRLNLTINPVYFKLVEAVICKGETFILNGVQYGTPGVFLDTMQTNAGCDSLFRLELVVSSPEPDLGADREFCPEDDSIFLSPGNFTSYIWDDGSTLSEREVTNAGRYTVIVIDQFGCEAQTSVTIRQNCDLKYFIPDAFSPNQDGINELFKVYFKKLPQTFELEIFDRWGERVAIITNPLMGWDGKFRHQELPPAVYIWVAKIDGKVVSGDLVLYR